MNAISSQSIFIPTFGINVHSNLDLIKLFTAWSNFFSRISFQDSVYLHKTARSLEIMRLTTEKSSERRWILIRLRTKGISGSFKVPVRLCITARDESSANLNRGTWCNLPRIYLIIYRPPLPHLWHPQPHHSRKQSKEREKMSAIAFALSFIGSCSGILSNCSIIVLVILTKQVSCHVKLPEGQPSFLIHYARVLKRICSHEAFIMFQQKKNRMADDEWIFRFFFRKRLELDAA